MRILRRYTSITAITAAIFACSSNAENVSTKVSEPAAASNPVSYEWREDTQQVDDESSPLGYWEVDVRYPLFASTNPQHEMEALNTQVEALRKSYSCKTKGDETFTADVKFAGPGLVSLTYEAMWYCPNMAGPDSRSGVINFDPAAGTSVTLADQVASCKTEALASLLAQKAKQAWNDGNKACRGGRSFGEFYRNGDEIVFSSSEELHGAAGCSVSVSLKQIDSYFKQGSPLTDASRI